MKGDTPGFPVFFFMKRICSFFLTFIVCFLSFYSAYTVDVYALSETEIDQKMREAGWEKDSRGQWKLSGSKQSDLIKRYDQKLEREGAFEPFTDADFDSYGVPLPESYGKGLPADQCTLRQLRMRRLNEEACISQRLSELVGNATGAIFKRDSEGPSGFFEWVNSQAEIKQQVSAGNMTWEEYYLNKAGIDNHVNSADYDPSVESAVVNLSSSTVTLDPDLLNMFQKYIDELKEASSDFYIVNTLNSDSIYSYCGGYTGALYSDWPDHIKGFALNKKNFVNSKLKYGWPVFFYTMPWNNGTSNMYLCICWVESPMSDFVFYANGSSIVSKDSLTNKYAVTYYMRRKDNQPFTVKYMRFNSSDDTGTEEPQSVQKNQIDIFKLSYYKLYGLTVPDFKYRDYHSEKGLFYNGDFGVYKSAGHMSSAMTYGPSIPAVIQGSGDHYYDHPVTVNGDQVTKYDYSTVINNIGDTTGMNADELQHRIDEVLTEMGAISGNTQDIKENTELQVSWLRKIYDKLCDVYDKMGSGLSGGQIFEWEWLQVKLDAIIALLGLQTASDWLDDLTDAGGDVVDIATDIGDEIILKFPFCVPWDMMLIINALKAVPETPVFEIPFKIPSWGVDETITLDLSNFQILSSVAKWFFDILYGFAITKFTLKILQVEFVGTSG